MPTRKIFQASGVFMRNTTISYLNTIYDIQYVKNITSFFV